MHARFCLHNDTKFWNVVQKNVHVRRRRIQKIVKYSKIILNDA